MNNIYESIIFDFDGTLFQTEKLAIPAFEKTFMQLKDDGYEIEEMPTEKQFLNVIGMTTDEVWKKLLPNLPSEVHDMADGYMLKNELEGIKEGYGALYPGVSEVLYNLKNKGYRLFVASNGLEEYIKTIVKAFRIDHYFEAMYTAGQFQTKSKVDLVKKLIKDYTIGNGVFVGDRNSDVEAGKSNYLIVVGCDFGFASKEELEKADVIIQDFNQLISIIEKNV